MAGIEITEPWYRKLAERHGREFALRAGYFEESRPWSKSYSEILGGARLRVPPGTARILQFSGAFWPLHDGHLEALQTAIDFLGAPTVVFLHVDHEEYRHSKGAYSEERFKEALLRLSSLHSDWPLETRLIREDEMPVSCSRNFTRLYEELVRMNPDSQVWFLAGGDRASFCLSFVDEGRCLIVGRDQAPAFHEYSGYQNERIVFLPGNNPSSSARIRRGPTET